MKITSFVGVLYGKDEKEVEREKKIFKETIFYDVSTSSGSQENTTNSQKYLWSSNVNFKSLLL